MMRSIAAVFLLFLGTNAFAGYSCEIRSYEIDTENQIGEPIVISTSDFAMSMITTELIKTEEYRLIATLNTSEKLPEGPILLKKTALIEVQPSASKRFNLAEMTLNGEDEQVVEIYEKHITVKATCRNIVHPRDEANTERAMKLNNGETIEAEDEESTGRIFSFLKRFRKKG
jgi:hypothetical protein